MQTSKRRFIAEYLQNKREIKSFKLKQSYDNANIMASNITSAPRGIVTAVYSFSMPGR